MERMKIAFTTKEYARLLELAYLGQAVVDGRMETDEKRSERYEELVQKLLSLAEAHGCADLVESDGREWWMSEKLEHSPAGALLDKFEEEVFWDQLASRLAARDLQTEQGKSAESAKPTPAELEKLESLAERYWAEFEKNGIDHLQLLRGGRG